MIELIILHCFMTIWLHWSILSVYNYHAIKRTVLSYHITCLFKCYRFIYVIYLLWNAILYIKRILLRLRSILLYVIKQCIEKTMRSAKRILLSSVIIFECLKLTLVLQINIPKPDTVYLSVPFDQLKNIQWLENPNYMESTCGRFKAYNTGTIKKVKITNVCKNQNS